MTAGDETTTTTEARPGPPTGDRRIAGALLRYRVLAWVTGLWLLFLTAEMIAKYGFGVDTPSWIAVVHGWAYFIYLVLTADLAVKVRWPLKRTVGTLLAGTIPLLSFFVEHRNTQQVKRDFGV